MHLSRRQAPPALFRLLTGSATPRMATANPTSRGYATTPAAEGHSPARGFGGDTRVIWDSPSPAEYCKEERDAWRWAWHPHLTVDGGGQLVSVQTDYVSEGYGMRVVLLPTMRVGRRQFFDSAADDAIAENAFVLQETLHSPAEVEYHRSMQSAAFGRAPYASLSRDASGAVALQRGTDPRMQPRLAIVGGGAVSLEYLQTLLELHCAWALGDPPLAQEALQIMGVAAQHRISFIPQCAVREAHLACMLDRCFEAAGCPDSWERLTGQRCGAAQEKVVLLPWNGRHCHRLERFLVEFRGFTPGDEASHRRRVVLDAAQTAALVARSQEEDRAAEAAGMDLSPLDELPDFPFPEELPAVVPPRQHRHEH